MSISKQTLTEINDLISKDEFVERRKVSTLIVGRIYVIKKINCMATRFGKSIVVTLYDPTENATFESFLPKRVVETLTDDTVEKMNKASGQYSLTYLGQSSNVVAGGNSRALLNFGCL